MQSYDWGSISYNDASHRYWIHIGDDKIAVPSVTTALDILAKPQLLRWYEQMGIEGTREALQRNLINPGDTDLDWTKTVRENQLGAEARRDEGAARGTAVHEALREYHSEGKIPKLSDFPGPEEAYVAGLQAWLVSDRPEPVYIEQMVASPKHQFAGRFDLLADFKNTQEIIDLKTRKKAQAYPADMLQLDGYWQAAQECGITSPTGAAILAIGADGSYKVTHMPREAHGGFTRVLEARRVVEGVRKALREPT